MKTNQEKVGTATLLLFVALAANACGDVAAERYRFGENITGLRFTLYDETEGIHPSKVVLENPNNPFATAQVGDATKFAILANGGNAGAFYAWASTLARIATGEHQFYTAQKLGDIADAKEVPEADQPKVEAMAIEAYQAVLDYFPDSVSFDATGTVSFRLATPAYKAILARGGKVSGNWVLVQTPDGREEAVQGGSFPTLPEEIP